VMDQALSPLIVGVCLGIDASGELSITRMVMWRWVGEGRFLPDIATYLRWQAAFDADLCVAVTSRAIEFGDADAVLSLINTATSRYDKEPSPRLIDDVFMPIVDYLTAADKSNWVIGAWGVHRSGLVAALDEAQSQRVLRSFVEMPEIEFHAG